MVRLMSLLLVLAFATVVIADAEVPLPGPGAPPSEPPPPQPTRAPLPTPTPPPYDEPPYPTPTPYPEYPTPTPYPGYPPPGQDTTYTLGSGQVGRLGERTFTFQPPSNLRNIRALRVTCTNEKIKIKSVTVKFVNGQTATQAILEGLYRYGESRLTYMYSTPVSFVTVVAASSSVFRTNGSFRLDAAATMKNAKDE